jgi:putative protein-disulfide isomerase
MVPMLFYCYDAYCGWCYGFSPVIRRIADEYGDRLDFEVLSGGMIGSTQAGPIGLTASYIQKAYKRVEEYTGIKFGEDYLWHIFNPDKSDWFPSSEKPAIALCIFKEIHPGLQISFAGDLQHALYAEGRDLCDDEAYRHLLEKYMIPAEEFYTKLHSKEYLQKANDEFELVKKLQVTSFPAVLLQEKESRFYLVAKGFRDYESLKGSLEAILTEISSGGRQPALKNRGDL